MLEPGTAMAAEGIWDHTKNQLCLLLAASKQSVILLTDNPVDQCTIGITLAFPAVLTIERRSSIVGRIWSILNETTPGYFAAVPLLSFGYNTEYDLGLRYKYTKMDSVRNLALTMMMMMMKRSGFANPVALGETLYRYPSMDLPELMAKDSEFGMGQAAQSIWRTDIEIVMVLISLTFSCIFAGFQLLHASKHPGVLPSISITMLVVLTLGHMIILVLNFEAFSGNHKNQNVLPGGAKNHQLCLVICIAGGFLAWFVHPRPRKVLHHVPHLIAEAPHSHWEDMQSYAGLILDGFLFPQLILNALCDSKERSLSLPFYVGTTILRVLPHVYDAYRSNHYVPRLESSYIYARPNGDLYSLVWDIIIPCGGVSVRSNIYIQQRFSGRSIFCRRRKSPGMYEMVPVSSS
ncbi:hypothetical protein KSP40_PGU017287 [Platanthera guangdongensis]|uniref:RING-type E3 ubiquitin transferase n=1 Tax=Platanthera guangdongensis TaxID=2320717 RepID=A0ABR2LDT7_9ASPA